MNPVTNIKAQTLAAALNMILGYQPFITETKDGKAILNFKDSDAPKIRASLENMAIRAGKAPKSDVAVNFAPVVAPLALKYVAPVVIGIAGAGLIAGYLMGQKRGSRG